MLNSKRDDTQTDIGTQLRNRRKALGLTMQQVADAAGLSAGFISQVERGLTAPSLSSLASLATVLEAHISDFLTQPAADIKTRQTNRATYSVPGSQLAYERVSSSFDGSVLHSVIMHEQPGQRSEPISHVGEEMFYIIAGAVTIELEGEVFVLSQGDSFHFDSRRVHSGWNHTTEVATILWCGTLDIFGDAPSLIHPVQTLRDTHPEGS